jgi:virulence-associated protein VagC
MSRTAEVQNTDQGQIVRLPAEFHLSGDRVSVRQEGQSLVLEPIQADVWAPDFFDEIRIDDPSFTRPDQGELPSVASLD